MKYLMALTVIILVIFTYIMFAVNQPVINEIVATTNVSINGTLFPETKNFVNWWPLLQWTIPGGVGLFLIVYFLKFWKGNGE